MLKRVVFVLAGAVVAAGLMAAAVALWMRTLIIFAAPLGVASLAAIWVTIDNQFVYRPKRPAPPAGVESPPEGSTGA